MVARLKRGAKVVGKIEKKKNNQSQITNNQVTINISSQTESNSSETSSNNNQNEKVFFEIRISGELTKDKKAKYKDIKRRIEDIVEKLATNLRRDKRNEERES